jgi:hypothetical protein
MAKWTLKDLFWISDPVGDEPPPPSDAGQASHTGPRSGKSDSPIEATLSMLRDVKGVVGSIAVANAGDVLGSDLPRAFDGAATEALAVRLGQLRAALAGAEHPLKTAALRYQGHSLFVSQLDCGLLGVLAESQTQEPALDMVARLVGQRLNASLARK